MYRNLADIEGVVSIGFFHRNLCALDILISRGVQNPTDCTDFRITARNRLIILPVPIVRRDKKCVRAFNGQ
jgi:hypothetical protein